jgi:hypothetical protein
MKRLICISLLLYFFLTPAFSEREKEVHVKKIRGEYSITTDMDITPKAAAQMALNDAKHKAMVKVCGERLNSWDMIESGSNGESFNSVNMIQVDGDIVDYEILEEGHITNPAREKEITFYCVINATVKKGIEPDPDFTVSVRGIKASYQADDEITFSILSSRDAYLKVFIFENEELGYKLYPNEFETSFKITANQECKFPSNRRSVYTVYTDKEIETDRLVFVLTKSERPFINETTSRKEIESWMAQISNDQKFVYYTSINILKR